MKKYLSILLGLILIVCMGCEANQINEINQINQDKTEEISNKIPADFSEEFYNDMLIANDFIEKSIATGYSYLKHEYNEKIAEYFYIIYEDERTEEIEALFIKKGLDINRELTKKEIRAFNILLGITLDMGWYESTLSNEKNKKYIEETREKLKEQHRQFKTILEIKEPK